MEHILQFGINIDDETIKNRVETAATQLVAQDIKNQIFKINRYNPNYIEGFQYPIEELIKETISSYKDEIIERSAELVVDSIKRSKKYKEVLAKITEEN